MKNKFNQKLQLLINVYVTVGILSFINKKVGFDVGISELLTLSNGDVHNNKRFYVSTLLN